LLGVILRKCARSGTGVCGSHNDCSRYSHRCRCRLSGSAVDARRTPTDSPAHRQIRFGFRAKWRVARVGSPHLPGPDSRTRHDQAMTVFWLDDGQSRGPRRAEWDRTDPQQAVPEVNYGRFLRTSEARRLVAQSQVLALEGGTRTEDRDRVAGVSREK